MVFDGQENRTTDLAPEWGSTPHSSTKGEHDYYACYTCRTPYDPVRHRWLCPTCHVKDNCCDGHPLPINLDQDCD